MILGKRGRAAAMLLLAFGLSGVAESQGTLEASATIDTAAPGVRIDPNVYGQFTEHLGSGVYGGIWVGKDSSIPNIHGLRKDVVEALKKLKVPVVRWPGGCYADLYHWRDGIGPQAERPITLNRWWGNVEESNQFGTHEFFEFAELIGAKTYLSINLGTGTPAEATDWIEYVTSPSKSRLADLRRANDRAEPWKIDYLGIGNEMWGCGGTMDADYYANVLRQYATFVKPALPSGTVIFASGPSADDYHWTDVMMEKARESFSGLSLHYYTLPTGDWKVKGQAIGFPETEWASTFTQTRRMEQMIREHDARMDRHDPGKKQGLIVDEWGTWYDVTSGTNPGFLQQQNTLRDALVAAINFNIFHRHADRVQMANIAQTVNVLQAMILTDGPRMTLTPTYHAFMMYQPFQGASALPVTVQTPDYVVGTSRQPAVDVSAARDAAGALHVALVNIDPQRAANIVLAVKGTAAGRVSGQLLTAARMDAHNDFDDGKAVVPTPFGGARWKQGRLEVSVPAKSLVVLKVEQGGGR